MKLTLSQIKDHELEVIVIYSEVNDEVREIVKQLRTEDYSVLVKDEGERKLVKVNEIYYIESLERKTFLYTKSQVYRTEKKIPQLAKELSKMGFLYVSRTCLLNVNKLQSIMTVYNSKLEGTLTNGEKIQISRNYAYNIKQYFERGI